MKRGLPRIVALAGYRRSGKNTAAEIFRDELSYQVVAWADLLREACAKLNPIIGGAPPTRWAEALDQYGYEAAKSSPVGEEFVAVMQRMGTDVGRNLLGQDIWVDALMRRIDAAPPEARFAIADTRFPNEADAVKARDGMVIRIERPGTGEGELGQHISETALAGYPYDAVVQNDAGRKKLAKQILRAVEVGVPAKTIRAWEREGSR
jgi:hypothetical protein